MAGIVLYSYQQGQEIFRIFPAFTTWARHVPTVTVLM